MKIFALRCLVSSPDALHLLGRYIEYMQASKLISCGIKRLDAYLHQRDNHRIAIPIVGPWYVPAVSSIVSSHRALSNSEELRNSVGSPPTFGKHTCQARCEVARSQCKRSRSRNGARERSSEVWWNVMPR
jgi:hypothetical protein